MRCKLVGDAFIPGLGEFDTSDRLPSWFLRILAAADINENYTRNKICKEREVDMYQLPVSKFLRDARLLAW